MATWWVDTALGSDSNLGTSAGAGNAFATWAKAATSVAAGDLVNVIDSGVYTFTTALAVTVSGTAAAGPVYWRGYSVTPGDGGKARVTSATTTVNLFEIAAAYNTFDSIALSHTGATRGSGFIPKTADRLGINVLNCTIDGCLRGIDGDDSVLNAFFLVNVENCEIKNCTSHGISSGFNLYVSDCFIHNNAASGVDLGADASISALQSTIVLLRNVIYGNLNNVRDSRTTVTRQWVLKNNTLHSPTTDNFKSTLSAQFMSLVLHDNIIYHAGTGWGLNLGVAPALLNARNNAYGANFAGNLNNCPAGVNDIALTGDPCTSAGTTLSGFIPNNTTGAGKIVRNAGVNGVDVGAYQHADPVVTLTVRQPRYRIGTGS